MKDLSFSSLMKEGKKIQSSLKETAKRASDAIINNKKIASNQLDARKRLDICNKCSELAKGTGRCQMCGCFVALKVKLDFEECPLHYW